METAVIVALIAAFVSLVATLVNIKIARDTSKERRSAKAHEEKLRQENENTQSVRRFLSAAEGVRIQLYYLAWAVEEGMLTYRNERLEEMISDYDNSHKKYVEAWEDLRPLISDKKALFFAHSMHRQGNRFAVIGGFLNIVKREAVEPQSRKERVARFLQGVEETIKDMDTLCQMASNSVFYPVFSEEVQQEIREGCS